MLGQYPTQDADGQRCQALASVYALLLRLAEDKETLKAQVVVVETEAPREVKHEFKRKGYMRASLPSPGAED
jgi:hypothetical protein